MSEHPPYLYYRIEGGPVLAAIHRRLMDCQDAGQDAVALKREVGAQGLWGVSHCFLEHRVTAFAFPEGTQAPYPGLRLAGKDNDRARLASKVLFIPDRRYKAGKWLAEQLEAITLGSPAEIWDAAHLDLVFEPTGMQMYEPSIGRIGNTWVIGQPVDEQREEYREHRTDIPGMIPISAEERENLEKGESDKEAAHA